MVPQHSFANSSPSVLIVEHRADVHDQAGRKALRAKYIGNDGGRGEPTWLVYGDDCDTCGAIVEYTGANGRWYQVNQRGEAKGVFIDLRRAVARCLKPEELVYFL